jgi:anti-sigma regulatory factor (Ser/Thr protein kinase)
LQLAKIHLFTIEISMQNNTYITYGPEAGSYSFLKENINKQAADAGFSAEKLGELELIVNEMTTNLKTATGELMLCIAEEKNRQYLELICIDNEPSIADPEKRLLGSSPRLLAERGFDCIKRLADHFEVHTMLGWGTMLICRIFKNSEHK